MQRFNSWTWQDKGPLLTSFDSTLVQTCQCLSCLMCKARTRTTEHVKDPISTYWTVNENAQVGARYQRAGEREATSITALSFLTFYQIIGLCCPGIVWEPIVGWLCHPGIVWEPIRETRLLSHCGLSLGLTEWNRCAYQLISTHRPEMICWTFIHNPAC